MTKARVLRTSALLVALAAAAPAARAQSPLEDLPAVRNKTLLHDGRHAIAPVFGVTIHDDYVRNVMLGASWTYWFTNWIGLGVDVMGGLGVDRDLTDRINEELSTPTQTFELSTSSLQLLADVRAELTAIDGKFMLFGKHLVRLDLHLQLGAGVAMINGTGRIDDSISVAPLVGVGTRFFAADWLAVGVDVRDYLINRVLAARRDGSLPGKSFGHNWFVGFSFNFFLPGEPSIRP